MLKEHGPDLPEPLLLSICCCLTLLVWLVRGPVMAWPLVLGVPSGSFCVPLNMAPTSFMPLNGGIRSPPLAIIVLAAIYNFQPFPPCSPTGGGSPLLTLPVACASHWTPPAFFCPSRAAGLCLCAHMHVCVDVCIGSD